MVMLPSWPSAELPGSRDAICCAVAGVLTIHTTTADGPGFDSGDTIKANHPPVASDEAAPPRRP